MSIEHFRAGSFSVTEEEKANMSAKELAELEKKIQEANARKAAEDSEKAIEELEEAIAKDLEDAEKE